MKGVRLICEDCKEASEPVFQTIKRTNYHEVIVKCSECGSSTTCYYTDNKIRKLQKEQVNAREARDIEEAERIYEEVSRRMNELKERIEGREVR